MNSSNSNTSNNELTTISSSISSICSDAVESSASLFRQCTVNALAQALQRLFWTVDFLANASLPASTSLTIFHCECLPPISIADYVQRLCRFIQDASVESIVSSFVYLEMVWNGHNQQQLKPVDYQALISPFAVHRLFLTSLMVSCKFNDDHCFNNAFFAKIGGIPLHEINRMEVEFLCLINYELFLPSSRYLRFLKDLIAVCSDCFQVEKNGGAAYTNTAQKYIALCESTNSTAASPQLSVFFVLPNNVNVINTKTVEPPASSTLSNKVISNKMCSSLSSSIKSSIKSSVSSKKRCLANDIVVKLNLSYMNCVIDSVFALKKHKYVSDSLHESNTNDEQNGHHPLSLSKESCGFSGDFVMSSSLPLCAE